MDEGETMQPVDEYALMEWLKEEALKAHNIACSCNVSKTPSREQVRFESMEDTFNFVIAHIQNGRTNQRPHVKERI